MKSAMLSWSYIEEYFLPTSIEFVAMHQKVKLDNEFLKGQTAFQLIRYYYLISYDREMYDLLEKARKHRNKMTHDIYTSKSIEIIEKRAKASAIQNLHTIGAMFDRQDGVIIAPALMIYTNARNDLRKDQRKKLKQLMT